MNESRKQNWFREEKLFFLRLSRFNLRTIKLRAATLEAHFSSLSDDPNSLEIPFDQFGDEVDVFIVRPHPTKERLPNIAKMPRAIRYVPAQYRRWYTDLSGTFDDYIKKWTPKSRKNLQRSVRHYIDHVKMETPWREYRTASEIEEFYNFGRAIAQKTYQEKLVGGGLPADPNYVREMQRLASLGLARGHILFHGDKPVAYVYLVIQHGVVMFESTGFDPEYRDFSPGKILLYHVLQGLFEEKKYPAFDYGEGEGPHKEFFGTHDVPCAEIYYFCMRPKPLAAVAGLSGLFFVGKGIKRALSKAGIADDVKRLVGVKNNKV